MINVEGISKSFGATKVLNSISFQVKPGTIVGFLGENGAGKTTTLDIVSGCIGSDCGRVEICGFDLDKEPVKAKAKLGYLPDEPPTFDEMSVIEYLTFCSKLRGLSTAKTQESIQKLTDFLELNSVLRKKIDDLSKGFKQRVGLAQALVHNPEVLILDEPTEGLDPSQIAQMRNLLIKLKSEKTILISSHILSELEKICDDVIIINNGKLLSGKSIEFQSLQNTYKSTLNTDLNPDSFEKIISGISTMFNIDSYDYEKREINFVVSQGEDDLFNFQKLLAENGAFFTSLINQSNNYESFYFKIRNSDTKAQESI